MAYQLSTEDILTLAAAPLLLGAARSGRTLGQAGRAAQAYRNMQRAGIDLGTASPALDAVPGGLTYEQLMNVKNNLKAKEYPKKYHAIHIPVADGMHNSGRDQAMINEAGRMQEMKEHNNALFKHLRPGMTPQEVDKALKKGFNEEQSLPAYWDDNSYRREMDVKSDAVRAIRITPDAKIQVMWKGQHSKNNPDGWYTFRQFPNTYEASLEVQKLLNEPSLGHAVMPILTMKGGDKLAAKGYGRWNAANYNGAYAG